MRRIMKRSVTGGLVLLLVAALTPTVALAGLSNEPTGLTATSGNLQVSLSWTAPSSNGGETITDYIIEYSSDGGVVFVRFMDPVSTATAATVTGLTNGFPYLFRVSAVVNVSGQGPASTTATATPASNHTPFNPAQFSACPTGVITSAGFSDVSSADVDCIKYYDVTRGTTATTYSPLATVTRWQMALFLTRMVARTGVALPSGGDQGFSDIANKSTEIQTAVNQLKQLNVTVGKTATTYAPDDNVTREEMALFITRLLKVSKVGPGGNEEFVTGSSGPKEIKSNDTDFNFTDISYPGISMEIRSAITNLWNLGITDVQTATTYEPTADMTRQAMATFMVNALAHTNARPKGLTLTPSTYRVQGTPLVYFSVTNRTDEFAPIADSVVDTFKFQHTVTAGVVRFDSSGFCSGIVVSTAGNVRCTVDVADPKTDANGNLATFWEVMPSANKVDVWAWTANPTTIYDNDIHETGSSMVTVETYP